MKSALDMLIGDQVANDRRGQSAMQKLNRRSRACKPPTERFHVCWVQQDAFGETTTYANGLGTWSTKPVDALAMNGCPPIGCPVRSDSA